MPKGGSSYINLRRVLPARLSWDRWWSLGEVRLKLSEQLLSVVGQVQVDMLLLESASEPFDKDIVGGAAPPIATDAAVSLQQHLPISWASELITLVGDEDLRGWGLS